MIFRFLCLLPIAVLSTSRAMGPALLGTLSHPTTLIHTTIVHQITILLQHPRIPQNAIHSTLDSLLSTCL